MLLLFKLKNYTSFKNETILDLRTTAYTQHPSHIHNIGEYSLVKTTAIYGANASGKSNFISAMFFFKQYIFSQFISKKKESSIDEPIRPNGIWEPFSLKEGSTDPEEFEIVFLMNNHQIQYGFEIFEKKVLNEWLYIDDKMVYERNANDLKFGNKYKSKLQNYNKIPSERLYISVLEYFLDDESKNEIIGDFISFFENEFNIYTEILFESTVKRIAGSATITKKLIEDTNYRKRIAKYLSKIDVGIQGLEIVDIDIKDNFGRSHKQKTIKTIHNVYDEEGNIVGTKAFDLNQESTGTIRFLAYIQNITNMIDNGGVFIVDEMSARLHPLLTKLIIDIFQSSSNTKAQLVFTTHDISLLNHSQFRRDEVVFVDKNEKGESSIYALSDLKVREDATFNKDYLQGKYGAIPVFDYDVLVGGYTKWVNFNLEKEQRKQKIWI